MTRRSFLTFASVVALAVGLFALSFPGAVLVIKGIAPDPALSVWVREVGVLVFAAGVTTLLAREAPDSLALRALLIGDALLHVGLLPIELVALSRGIVTKLSGVAPNSILHVGLAIGFIVYARRIRVASP